MRRPQPTLRDGRMRINRADEYDFAHVGGEDTKDAKDIGVGCRRRNAQSRGEWSGDFGLLRKRLRQEGEAVAPGIEG